MNYDVIIIGAGPGVIVQRFGDLIRGRRSTPNRMNDAFITPTLNATPVCTSSVTAAASPIPCPTHPQAVSMSQEIL